MREQIHTIPIGEALAAAEECPFCWLRRQAEQRAIGYFAGSCASYMEPSVRAITNRTGFCREHTKKLYDYGNPLGSALMIQTHYETVMLQLQEQLEQYEILEKRTLFRKKKPEQKQPIWQQMQQQADACAICDQVEESVARQYNVFFSLLKEPEFRQRLEQCNGFCMPHFARLLQTAESDLPPSQAAWFYPTVYRVMQENLARVKADLDLLIRKYDYRNANLPWDNARDALPRAMQKMAGIQPADAPYRKD